MRVANHTLAAMKLLLENLPPSLEGERDSLARCLSAMHQAVPFREAILFGSHARGEAGPDSDVDLCLVSAGAEHQLAAAAAWRRAMDAVWPRPSFTLIPISPARLAEKKAGGDFFFGSILTEGVLLAQED